MSEAERFLVTGALGCIGAWVLRNLAREGVPTVALDVGVDPVRPRMVMTPDELSRVQFVQGDIRNTEATVALVEEHSITHIVHLAGLQVPACRANPALGVQVNVLGTVNVLEAARRSQGRVRGLAYASSVAAMGPSEFYPQRPVADDVPLRPETLYGVYKMADEHIARLYWQDWRIGSVGLRPYIVFGVGRDQGVTSDIAKAILAAAADRPYHIHFDGLVGLQYVDDVARMFIAGARAAYHGAAACNLRNDVMDVGHFVEILIAEVPDAQITVAHDQPLPFPADLDDSGLHAILGAVPHTPLPCAVRATLEQFGCLLSTGQVDLSILD